MPSRSLHMRIPAERSYLPVVAAVSRSFGAAADLTLDRIDDLDVATTESALHLTTSTHAETIDVHLSDDTVGIGVRLTCGPGRPERHRALEGLPKAILDAVASDIVIDGEPDSVSIRFRIE